jgi:putative hydrolase of the HAD superfamily
MFAGGQASDMLGSLALYAHPVNGAPATILFDLDDTILDDTGSVPGCWRRARCEDEAAPAALEAEVRRVAAWYWSDPQRHRTGRAELLAATTAIVSSALQRLGRPDEALAQRVAGRYRALRVAAIRPIPGAIETLERLRGDGIALGLITNGDGSGQRAKLARFDLERLFDYIGVEGELGFGKPDPRAYSTAIKALGAGAAATWMVGDNLEWDVLAPQRHGIAGIWVNPAGGDPEPGGPAPWRVIAAVADLI